MHPVVVEAEADDINDPQALVYQSIKNYIS